MAGLAPLLKYKFTDGNNDPLVGGKIYTYSAGTLTPRATYTDSSGSVENDNPTILDANGEAEIWIGTGSYKFVIATSADAIVDTIDNVSLPGAAATEVPSGGSSGQVLTKNSATDYDYSWSDPSIGRAGQTTIGNGVNTCTVTFSSPMPSSSYAILVSIKNTVDADPIFLQSVITAQDASGFTVDFNGFTDSLNYYLHYAATATN